MATMNISLPDGLKAYVEKQARNGRFANVSDYVRDLIRRDQERAAQRAELERLIQEGLDSGISDKSIDEIFDDARQRAIASGATP
jgi:antitoxin ParD1/3/4